MNLSLSTNWCSRTITDGEAIAEKAAELGFDSLELGYAATEAQAQGIKRKLDTIPVGSVHAFSPVPVSAPYGHPELYRLASFDAEARAIADMYVTRCVEFAADIGANSVVLHAGRIALGAFLDDLDSHRLKQILCACGGDTKARRYTKALSRAELRRWRRGRKMMEVFSLALDNIIPVLEKHSVVLALENMPYLEGFPNENEAAALLERFAGSPLKTWYDTGHHQVRVNHGWTNGKYPFSPDDTAGMHLNDVIDLCDDHLAPGEGNVDFASLGSMAANVKNVVFEPSPSTSEESLKRSALHIREIWGKVPCQ